MKLQVTNLSWNNILKNVSFSAESGEFIWLMGLNGSGKSSLLRCLAGVTKNLSHCILYDGKSSKEAQVNGLIGYVPQQASFSSTLTVFEAIEICRSRYKTTISTEVILEEVKLKGLSNRSLNELSGGERQKLLIALALIHSPEVLLLDEPLAHLDIRAEQEIIHILKNQKNKLILMVSHDYMRAAKEASKILMMNCGILSVLNPPFTNECLEISLLSSHSEENAKIV